MKSWQQQKDPTLKRDTILSILVLAFLFITPPCIMLYENSKESTGIELDQDMLGTPSTASEALDPHEHNEETSEGEIEVTQILD